MNLKPHIKPAFLYSLFLCFVTLYFNPLWDEGDWTKIGMVYLISVLLVTVIASVLRAAGYAMMKSFTEPEDGPLS